MRVRSIRARLEDPLMSEAAWSDDRVSTLSKLWADGLSAAQIARQLGGVTRNAVIGKVHRLGLSGRSAPSRPSRPARTSVPRLPRAGCPARALRPGPARRCDVVALPVAEEPGLVRDMARLTSHVCRWPIGDPKAEDFSFCGQPAPGRRYCAAHASLGVRPGTAWRATATPSSGARSPG